MPRVRRSRWRKRISTRSSERRMLWGLAWVLGAVLIGSVAVYVAQQITAPAMQDQTGPVKANVVAEASKPVTGYDWAAAYTAKLGGDKTLDGIKSVRWVGTLTTGGQTYALEILKKPPNLVRYQLGNKAGTLMLGSDGHDAWVAYRNAAGDVQVWDADAATRDWLWLQSPLGTWLAHPNSAEPKFVAETPVTTGAEPPTQPVSVISPDGRKATYYLDAQDLTPRRLELLDVPAGAAAEVADLEDWRVQQNIRLPYELAVRGPSGPVTTVEIQKAIFNSGILNAAFDRPLADDENSGPAPNPGPNPTANDDGGGSGMNAGFNHDFDANSMRVHNFVAQTNAFQNVPVPQVEPTSNGGDSTSGAPNLTDYGFPWPLPW